MFGFVCCVDFDMFVCVGVMAGGICGFVGFWVCVCCFVLSGCCWDGCVFFGCLDLLDLWMYGFMDFVVFVVVGVNGFGFWDSQTLWEYSHKVWATRTTNKSRMTKSRIHNPSV